MDRLQPMLDGAASIELPSRSGIWSGFLFLCVAYQAYKIIYRLYFHPLSKFPGPFWRAVSTIPDQWTKCIGKQLPNEYELHKKYGPVVRMSPGALSFINPQGWKDIYTHKSGKRQLQKDPKFYGIDGFGGGIPDDARHAREKKLLLRGFSDASLREQEPLYTPYFDLFVNKLTKEIEGPNQGKVDMHEWFSFVAFDIVGELIFAKSFGCLESGETHYFIHNIYRSIQFATIQQMAMRYRWLGYLIKLMYWLVPSFTMARKRHHAFTIDRVDNRMANWEGRNDIFTHIHRPKGEAGLTRDEIIAQCNTIVIAGSETITTLLSGCLYFLMKNPRVYEKLKAEVRGAFKTPDEMTMNSTARLPYLTAVLEESLRCYPPVPNRNPRRTGPNGDTINGHFVPPNQVVAMAGYIANHFECNFHNPFEFVPERWLEGKDRPAEYANDKLITAQAFSYGPRSCLGQNLAWVEMRSILARFVWHFECEMLPETDGWKERQKTFIIWNKLPLWMTLSKRKDLVA